VATVISAVTHPEIGGNTMKTKVCYGKEHNGRVLLRPLRKLPFMSPTPCALFDTKDEAETKAKEHGYRVEWTAED
jgi:hypothetical protein